MPHPAGMTYLSSQVAAPNQKPLRKTPLAECQLHCRSASAKSEPARVVVIFQVLGDLALLGVAARVLLGAVARGRDRRSTTGGGTDSAAGT